MTRLPIARYNITMVHLIILSLVLQWIKKKGWHENLKLHHFNESLSGVSMRQEHQRTLQAIRESYQARLAQELDINGNRKSKMNSVKLLIFFSWICEFDKITSLTSQPSFSPVKDLQGIEDLISSLLLPLSTSGVLNHLLRELRWITTWWTASAVAQGIYSGLYCLVWGGGSVWYGCVCCGVACYCTCKNILMKRGGERGRTWKRPKLPMC